MIGIFLGFVIEVSSRGVGVVVVVDIFGHLPDLQGGRINIQIKYKNFINFNKSNIHDQIKSLIFRIQTYEAIDTPNDQEEV